MSYNEELGRRAFLLAGGAVASGTMVSESNAKPGSMQPTVTREAIGCAHFRDVRTHFGAKGDGVTDDTAALQNALLARAPVFVPPGCYRITKSLAVVNGSYLYGSGRNWNPLPDRDSWIMYDGPLNLSAAVIRASPYAVGVLGSASSDTVTITDLVLDANGLAGFGLYVYHAINQSRFERLTAVNALADGVWALNVFYCVFRDLLAKDNWGNGFTLGVDTFQSGQDHLDMNGVLFENIVARGNGSAEAHNRTDPIWQRPGCGVHWRPHTACSLVNVTAESSYSYGLWVNPDYGPNTVNGVYLEANAQIQPAGQNKEALLVSPAAAAMRGLRIANVYMGGADDGVVYGGNPQPAGYTVFSQVMFPQWMYAKWSNFVWEQSYAGTVFTNELPAFKPYPS